MSRFDRILPSLLLTAALPTAAAAQVQCTSMAECPGIRSVDASVRHELTTAGLNAVLGGATAAAFRVLEGEPAGAALQAFWKGAAGGALIYAGKRVTVEPAYGAGLVGRQLASVGGSVVRNASAGRGVVEQVVLPFGPLRLYRGGGSLRLKVDVATLVASAAFMVAYDARLDPEASLSSGALILRGNAPTPGLTSGGATMVWAEMPQDQGQRLMAHERVHVLQYDQAFLSWGEPLERWAVERAPELGVLKHLDLGGATLALRSVAALAIGYQARPWEKEAYFLAQAAHPLQHPMHRH